MKPGNAANLSLLLVGVGWGLAFFLAQGMEPGPEIVRDPAMAEKYVRASVLLAGLAVCSIAGALWLSGYGWAGGARKRAGVALMAGAATLVGALGGLLHL